MTEDTLADFNSNKASLQRVDILLRVSADASACEDVRAYYKTVMNLRKEAYYKMTGKHKTVRANCINMWNELQKKYSVWQQHQQNYNIKMDILNALDRYELYLRDFMGEKGMLLTDKYDDEGL